MTRKIEEDMIAAINDRRDWRCKNTEVKYGFNRADVYLHGNHIASLDKSFGKLHLTMSGWPTVTTRSRLNALMRAYSRGNAVYQQEHEQFFIRNGHDCHLSADDWFSVDTN